MDLHLDTATNDLSFDSRGQVRLVRGAELVRQRCLVTLRTHRGEWFVNAAFGIPYLGEFFVRNPNLMAIRATLRATLAKVEGVIKVGEITLTHDPIARTLKAEATLKADQGEVSLTL